MLDNKVHSYLTSGQVIKTPYNIVKELVENSIDAKATKVVVEIESGGKKNIKVFDNGIGIHKADVQKAFEPHSTSKIKTISDIQNVNTLGFRGEALFSISMNAKVSILTKTSDDETGTFCQVNGGEFVEIIDKASINGTYITVNNLFYNQQHKLKFLRKDSFEQNKITELIKEFILTNPKIEFIYIIEGNTVLSSNGTNLYDAIYSVYGSEYLENAIYIDSKNNEGYSIQGYITQFRSQKSRIFTDIINLNGRLIKNAIFKSAVDTSMKNFLRINNAVGFIFDIKIPIEQVDVNILPDKEYVKFINEQKLFDFIYKTILNEVTFAENEKMKDIQHPNGVKPPNDEPLINTNSRKGISFGQLEPESKIVINHELVNLSNFDDNSDQRIASAGKIYSKIMQQFASNESIEDFIEPKNSEKLEQQTMKINDYKRVGTLFDSYIVCSNSDNMLLIDQHAAHERLNYDKLCKKFGEKIEKQPLLIPFALSLNSNDYEFLLSNTEKLKDLGIDIEEFGTNTIKITTMPVAIADIDVEKFFDDILDNKYIFVSDTNTQKDKIAMIACKSAIKGGMYMSDEEVDYLLNQIKQSKSPMICPHGRPYTYIIKKSEIEKWFGRKL